MKQQIMVIHGGDPRESYEQYIEALKTYPVDLSRHGLREKDFQLNLADDLGSDFQVIVPEMPNKRNAKYHEWVIWFEKFFQFFDDKVILVGSSLGATFLAKYLADNKFPKKISALILIAGCFEDTPTVPLYDFSLPQDLSLAKDQVERVILYHSKDDPVVPFRNLQMFQQAFPGAMVRVFEDKGHFRVPHLPELVEDIKKL